MTIPCVTVSCVVSSMYKASILIPVYNQEKLVVKALDCLPRRDDIEVLACDDGSTDDTLAKMLAYRYEHPELRLQVYSNGKNRGVAYTKNKLLDNCKGKYFHIHDSDDYVYTGNYSTVIDLLNDADIYCMDLIINDGRGWHVDDTTKQLYCAQIARFIRKDFAEGIQFPEEVRAGDDWYFAEALLKRNPVTVYTGIPAYHYNYPREGSLCDLRLKGILP